MGVAGGDDTEDVEEALELSGAEAELVEKHRGVDRNECPRHHRGLPPRDGVTHRDHFISAPALAGGPSSRATSPAPGATLGATRSPPPPPLHDRSPAPKRIRAPRPRGFP